MPFVDLLKGHFRELGNSSRQVTAFDLETEGLYGKVTLGGAWNGGDMVLSPSPLAFIPDMRPPYVGHKLKYDLRVLAEHHPEALAKLRPGLVLDTKPALQLLDENRETGLKGGAARYLSDVPEWWLEGWREDMGREELERYLSQDLIMTRALLLDLWRRLSAEGLLDEWLQIECPITILTAEMESRGITVDKERLQSISDSALRVAKTQSGVLFMGLPSDYIKCQREGCSAGMYSYKRGNKVVECIECEGTGQNLVALTSDDQLRTLLYRYWEFKPEGHTKTGLPSVDKHALGILLLAEPRAHGVQHRGDG